MMLRTTAPGPLTIALAISAGACQRTPKCHGELTRDDLYRLQQLDIEGADPCPELARPGVQLTTDHGLLVDDRPIAAFDALPREGVQKIQALFTDLRSSRELWKQLHPSKDFPGEVTVRISPSIDTTIAASVLKTSAFAGYPNLLLESGGTSLKIGWNVPGPPSPEPQDAPIVLRIEQTAQGPYRIQFEGPTSVAERSREVADIDSVAPWVAAQCGAISSRCAKVVAVDIRGPFVGTLALLRDVLRLPPVAAHPPWVEIGRAQP